jgi:hypothetical protein
MRSKVRASSRMVAKRQEIRQERDEWSKGTVVNRIKRIEQQNIKKLKIIHLARFEYIN